MSPTTSFLKVDCKHIVQCDDPGKKPILLRGAGLGGWMNMENFITGYSGHEHEMREAMLKVLGKDDYEYFFDRFLEYFFTDGDAQLFASLGLNSIRLPVNYRHFEDDMNPRIFKVEGFKHLDRVIDICARHGIYTIIDLHAVPGGQNIDWHSDAGTHKALFWDHKDFQDRTILIWERLAEHYRDNPWVAGYNPLNEPSEKEHVRLIAFYARVEKAIRAIDPHHILFFDGNTFGADFTAFMNLKPLPNSVYACHDYSTYGFPNPPEIYQGLDHQKAKLRRSFERKIQYMRKYDGPIWNGEFGPVYANPSDGPAWERTNEIRYGVLHDQLDLYDEFDASWSIWLWKDIGFQGMTYVREDTEYHKLLKPFLEKKKALALDEWGCDDTVVKDIFDPVWKWLTDAAPSFTARYPRTWNTNRYASRLIREMLLSEELCGEYARYFEGKSREELDALAKSFHIDNCMQRVQLNQLLSARKGA